MELWKSWVKQNAEQTVEYLKVAGEAEKKNLQLIQELERKIRELLPETYKILEEIKNNPRLREKINRLLWCSGCHSQHPLTTASLYKLLPRDWADFIVPNLDFQRYEEEYLCGPYWYIPSAFHASFCICPTEGSWNWVEKEYWKRKKSILQGFRKHPDRYPSEYRHLLEGPEMLIDDVL